MILRGVEVSGCGRFRERTRLVGLGEGVNVLAADNEAGKSTLFRAVRTCLFERHSAKGRAVEGLATQGAELPLRIAVTFSRAGAEYRIEKTFLRSVRAVLTRDGREIARDRAADDALWDLLGLVSGGRGGLEDAGRFGLLWVGQTKSFALEALSPGTADDLNRLIAAEVGELVGGERARAVLARVRAALAELMTDTGKPRTGGAWRTALERRDALRERRDGLARQAAILEDDIRALDEVRVALARHADPARRRALTEELTQAREADSRGRAAAEQLQRREIEARAAQAARAEVEGRLRRLAEDKRRIEETRAQLTALDADLVSLDAAAGVARGALASAMRTLEASEGEVAAAQAEEAHLIRLDQAHEARERIAEWRGRRDEAKSWAQRLSALAAEIAAVAIDARTLKRLDELSERIAHLRMKREAGSPRLTVTLGPAAQARVLIDGEPVTGDLDRPVLGPVTVSVGDLATIAIAPAGTDEADSEALSAAERDLSGMLADLGLAGVAEAKAGAARAQEIAREREDLRRRLTDLAAALEAGDGIAELETRIAAAEAKIAQALAGTGLDTLPGRAEIDARREALAEGRLRVTAARERALAGLDAARRADTEAGSAVVAARARRAQMLSNLDVALASSPDATREEDLDRLSREAAQARDREASARDAVAAQQAATPDADGLVDLTNRVRRLEQSIENHDLARQDLEKRLASLEEAVQRAGGLGLGEDLEEAEAELAMAEREAARREAEAASLRLVRDTIEETLAESRERYLAPVKRQVRPYLNALFPGSDLAISGDFTPAGLGRGGTLEAHEFLSDGTREQIAILVRLALADLLTERGEPVPIILDDALVYSDDTRIAGMFDALSRAAQSQQVIVFTCRNRAFDPLGGRLLRIETVREDLTREETAR